MRVSTRTVGALALAVGLAGLVVGIMALARSGDGAGEPPVVTTAAVATAPIADDPPSRADPHRYTVWLVEEAIGYYQNRGRDAAVDHYSSPDSVDGPWYTVIIDRDNRIIAHFDPDLVGESILGPAGTDVTGYRFGAVMAEADEAGRWVSYVLLNPDTGEEQVKHGWVTRHDGLLFVSGWYEYATPADLIAEPPTTDQPAEFTRFYVESAIEMYREQGREKTFEHYFSPRSAVGRWYLLIIDREADELVLHPDRALLGVKSSSRRDSKGYPHGAEMLAATEEGRWVSYYYRIFRDGVAVEEGDKHTWVKLHDGLLFASGWYENVVTLPTKEDDPAGYTQWLVQDAVDVHDAQGLDALLDRYNDPESMDGQWFIYVIGADGTVLADPTAPESVGHNIKGPAGVDLAGNRMGPVLLRITEEGAWLRDHYFTNPVTGRCEKKHSWAVRRGEVIIGSGWYEPPEYRSLLPSKCEPAHFTAATVQRAVERYRWEGLERTLAYHSSDQSVDGRWYVFILDAGSGEVLAHPANSYIGQNLTVGSEAYDDAGYFYAADLMKATEEGIVVRNVIGVPTLDEQNPFHTVEEVKHYFAVAVDGLIFVSGWYSPPPDEADPAEYARLLVGRALTRYDDRGLAATLAHYNSEASVDGQWYVFILEDRRGLLYTMAHAARPDLVGTTRERIDSNGYDYGAALAAVTESGGGEWVSYTFTNPQTGEEALKHTWAVRRGDLVFGVGWYGAGPNPATRTVDYVNTAVAFYEARGREATLDRYNSAHSVEGDQYLVVVEVEEDIILVHPIRPQLRGAPSSGPSTTDVDGYDYGGDMNATATEEGSWYSYKFPHPTSGEVGQKHSWVVRRDGLLFLSGWYESDSPG